MRILVTGANGFVGRHLCSFLAEHHLVKAAVRSADMSLPAQNALTFVPVKDIVSQDWENVCKGMDTVIHLAARCHILKEMEKDPIEEFRRINVAGTGRLANAAAAQGVKRFIFLSTIGVNGVSTQRGHGFTETDIPAPVSPYAISKWEAERSLRDISSKNGLEIVVIRSPLIYGPGVPGNFARLLDWIYKGLPVPKFNTVNHKSLISIQNLCSFIKLCVDNPLAANETFLVSDNEDVSTPYLIERLAYHMKRKVHMFLFPEVIVRLAAGTLRKEDIINHLYGSLTIEMNKAGKLLHWNPPLSLDEGLCKMAQHYCRLTR